MKNLVIIGGGTGLSTLLKGVKYIDDISVSAIVSVADDGGSTGILSHQFSIPAVGDLRRVIGSLSRDRKYLEQALEYRFKDTGTDLDNHSIGNLIITAEILRSNTFSEAIANVCKMLNVEGTIIPISNDKTTLCAEFIDGKIIKGESQIYKQNQRIKSVFYEGEQKPTKLSVEAILNADVIVLGIGSLYTSIIPNLIYPEVIQAMKDTKAKIYYFSNATTEPGETDGMTILDHVNAIEDHTFKGIVDEVIIPDINDVSKDTLKRYADANQFPLVNDLNSNTIKFVQVKLLTKNIDQIRHNEDLIEKILRHILK